MKIRQLATTLLLGLTILFAGSVTHAASFSNIISFGDSLSDNGAVEGTDSATGAAVYGFSEFTDQGKIWVGQLANYHGADLLDLAYGGAMTSERNVYDVGPTTGLDLSTWTGLTWQVNTLQSVYAPLLGPDTLVTVWAGGNDFNRGYNFLYPGDYTDALQTQDAETAVDNIITNLNTLASLGAQHIMVPNLRPEIGGDTFMPVFNAKLETELAKFQAGFSGTIYTIDVWGLYQDYEANNTPEEDLVWWYDEFHPSGLVNTDIAQMAIAATADDASGTDQPVSSLDLFGVKGIKGGLIRVDQNIYYATDTLDVAVTIPKSMLEVWNGDAEAYVVIRMTDGSLVDPFPIAISDQTSDTPNTIVSLDLSATPLTEGEYQIALILVNAGGDPLSMGDWYNGFNGMVGATKIEVKEQCVAGNGEDADCDGLMDNTLSNVVYAGVTVEAGGSTDITISNGTAPYTAVSSSDGVAAVSMAGSVATISGGPLGSAAIIVTDADDNVVAVVAVTVTAASTVN